MMLKSLDELGIVSRGRSRHRPRDAAHLYGGPYPLVQTGDIKKSGLYLTEYEQTYSQAGLDQSKLWPSGTLCITIAANIAETSILKVDACFPDSVIGFIPHEDAADVRYLKYLFDSSLKRRLQKFTQGVAQDNLSGSKLISLKFEIPHFSVQKNIADILSAYDDLIENNRRRIQLLEDSARLLYQEWFVHLRFPGFEEEEVVDGVPEGWDTAPLPVAIELNPTERLGKCSSIRGISMSALSESNMLIDMKLVETKEAPSGSRFRNGDTLLARITPCLENGKTAYVSELAEQEVACGSTEFIVMRGKLVSSTYTYCLARSQGFRDKAIKSMVGSSGRQRVVTSAFDSYTLAIPPEPLMNRFDTLTQPIFQQITTLNRQNHELAQARDLLLPRLMNGEIELETIAE